MLLPLAGRRLYYDLAGPEDGPVVCITHSLASDGGSWAEQVPALLQAGFRVLRLDMRGHGGSDPVAGDFLVARAGDEAGEAAVFAGGRAGVVLAADHQHRQPQGRQPRHEIEIEDRRRAA